VFVPDGRDALRRYGTLVTDALEQVADDDLEKGGGLSVRETAHAV